MEASPINAPHPDDSADEFFGLGEDAATDPGEFEPDMPTEEELVTEAEETAAKGEETSLPTLTPEQQAAEAARYDAEKMGTAEAEVPEVTTEVPDAVKQQEKLREIAAREAAQAQDPAAGLADPAPAADPTPPAESDGPTEPAAAATEGKKSGSVDREYIVFQKVALSEKVLKALLEQIEGGSGQVRVAYFELHRPEARNVNAAVATAYDAHKDVLGQSCDLAAASSRAFQEKHVEIKPVTETALSIS